MDTYTFFGTIRPEYTVPFDLSIKFPLIEITSQDSGVSCKATGSIAGAHVVVEAKNVDENVELGELKNLILESMVRPIVDALNYIWGHGYDVEINSAMRLGSRNTTYFGVGIPELFGAQSERPLPIEEISKLIYQSQPLCFAFGNLREAIRMADDTGFFCYRAIESVRQSFRKGEDGNNPKQSWERLRESLNIDESWIRVLTCFSDEQRHGNTIYMSGAQRLSALQHAWKVVDRFCVYLHQGSIPLSKEEFDLLK
jgi:hypothetical protein